MSAPDTRMKYCCPGSNVSGPSVTFPELFMALAQAIAVRKLQLDPVNSTIFGVDRPTTVIDNWLEGAIKVYHTSAAGPLVPPPGLQPENCG